ncbi:helix-turn-helix domain-containing protein [Limibacter armeniacum]|uniref:helix-turn-helix domain-containing protein n=1 Tax=Limibacter armeniacum TaxID=466084 RepID=UPI002FE57F4A
MLQYHQRMIIYYGIKEELSDSAIAREAGVHRSTVGREIKRNGGREHYHYKLSAEYAKKNQQEAMASRKVKGGGIVTGTSIEPKHEIWLFHTYNHIRWQDRIVQVSTTIPELFLRFRFRTETSFILSDISSYIEGNIMINEPKLSCVVVYNKAEKQIADNSTKVKYVQDCPVTKKLWYKKYNILSI